MPFGSPVVGLRSYPAQPDGNTETVAWCWDRPDSGRSFGISGMHFHENWKEEPYRRLVIQGILWTLKLPIPEGGADVQVPEDLYKLKPLN